VGSQRLVTAEILDTPGLPKRLVSRSYRELTAIHRLLGNTQFLISQIRETSFPVRRVLDVGSGDGSLLQEVSVKLDIDGVGIDVNPPQLSSIPILKADARCDVLPIADVAFSAYAAHHLSDHDVIAMIRNVGRYCRRFILLDVVRYWAPLLLFNLFIAPLVSPITAADGKTSIRRGFTGDELNHLVTTAVAGTSTVFRHSVSRLSLRQVVDITYY